MYICLTESGAYARKIGPALRDKFGYTSADYHEFLNGSSTGTASYLVFSGSSGGPDVETTLNAGRPVIFGGFTNQSSFLGLNAPSGSGHSWVGDGYLLVNYNCYGYLNFHMNWGWDGSYNGWFKSNDWAIRDANGTVIRNYQYCQDVTIDIHP